MSKKNKDKFVISFHFDSEEAAQHFLGYMSDGGGEIGFMESDEFSSVHFDYHSMNDDEFGPNVKVTTVDYDDEELED